MRRIVTGDNPQNLVVGIGNRYRRDDAVGLMVARLVGMQSPNGVTVIEGVYDAYTLIDEWGRSESVYMIDCAVSGLEAGFIHRFDMLRDTVPARMFACCSTHSFSLTGAVEAARVLGRLPRELILFGIEGSDVSRGFGLTAAVDAAARRLARSIVTELIGQSGQVNVRDD